MANGITETGAIHMPHRELGNFIIKIHKPLDNHLARTGPAACLRIFPRGIYIGLTLHRALALARAGHDGLHHTRHTNLFNRREVFLPGCRKFIRGGSQTQLLSCQSADALTVHGELRGARSGNNLHLALSLDRRKHISGNGFHLGHHHIRLFLLDNATQGVPIKHGDDMGPISHLHGRSIGVGIHGNHFHAVPLQLNNDFLAQFA